METVFTKLNRHEVLHYSDAVKDVLKRVSPALLDLIAALQLNEKMLNTYFQYWILESYDFNIILSAYSGIKKSNASKLLEKRISLEVCGDVYEEFYFSCNVLMLKSEF